MVQPNPIEDLTAEAELRADHIAEEEAEEQPKYVGDLPGEPDKAEHYRPGQDDQ